MVLHPSEESHFDEEFIELEDTKVPVSDLKVYRGKLVDEPDSEVSGAFIEGIFIGQVNSPKDGVYYIESAKRYENMNDAHAIIFHESDINSDEEIKRAKRDLTDFEAETGEVDDGIGCGLHKKSVRDILAKQQSVFTEAHRKKRESEPPKVKRFANENENPAFKYTQSANKRQKRQSGTQQTFPYGQSVCGLYLKVDPYLYDWIFNREGNKVKSYLALL